MKCSGCGTLLAERHGVLRRVTDAAGRQRPVALYTCPACRTQSEFLPSPSEMRAWALLTTGASLQAEGRFQEALACFESVLSANPNCAMAWYDKACILANIGRFEESLRRYDRALALDPRYAEAWHNKGCALRALGRDAEALECFNRALQVDARSAPTWTSKGNLLLARGDTQEALECYERALAFNPKGAQAWLGKGCALAQLARPREAVDCYDAALRLKPNYAQAWVCKASALRVIGQVLEALECYDRALAINPEDKCAQENKAALLATLSRAQLEEMLRIKRVYEPADRADGFRILVDRLWPRALPKGKARVDLWLKEMAPSDKLRKWYAHDPKRWQGFRTKYQTELRAKKEFVKQIKRAEKEHGRVTLLFAANDARRNNAIVLLGFLRRGGKS